MSLVEDPFMRYNRAQNDARAEGEFIDEAGVAGPSSTQEPVADPEGAKRRQSAKLKKAQAERAAAQEKELGLIFAAISKSKSAKTVYFLLLARVITECYCVQRKTSLPPSRWCAANG